MKLGTIDLDIDFLRECSFFNNAEGLSVSSSRNATEVLRTFANLMTYFLRMETGKIVTRTGQELLASEEVRKAYLGG